MPLSLSLFGTLRVEVDGAEIKGFARGKAGALLAYLAVEREHPHPRARIAGLLWPDQDSEQARQNLRQLIVAIRRRLGDDGRPLPFLVAGPASLHLDPAQLDADADAFASGDADADERIARAYQGLFLADLPVTEGAEWQDWLRERREQYARRAVEALRRLSDRAAAEERFDTALALARQMLAIDRWREDAHRQIMRVLAMSGQRPAAVRYYTEWCGQLAGEFGAEPEAETTALFRAIRQGVVPAADAPAAGTDAERGGERRPVTTLYARLALPAATDPEQLLAHRRAFQASGERLVGLGAFIAEQGEGALLAHFGYPAAQEEAARLAVEAGLALVAGGGAPVCCGIHTGPALVSPSGEAGERVVGMASQIARGLAEQATPGTVDVGAAAQRLARGFFHWTPLGRRALPGTAERLEVFRAGAPTGARTRLEAAAAGGLSLLIGRTAELERAAAAWQDARRGRTVALLLSGDPGVGKSRLVHELQRAVGGEAGAWVEHHCLRRHQHTPFHPLVLLLQRIVGIDPEADPAARIEALVRHADGGRGECRELRPLLEDLLATGGGAPREAPQRVRPALRQALRTVLERCRSSAPAVVVLEDLQWCDASSIEVLGELLDSVEELPLFLVATTRSPLDLPWLHHPRVVKLPVAPLDPEETEALVRSRLAEPLPSATLRELVRRSDGVPLFAEELAGMLADHGRAGIAEVPATLDDLLAARLEQIAAGRLAAQVAAVIGGPFRHDLFAAVLARLPMMPAAAIIDGLDELVSQGLMVRTYESGHEGYRFRHTMIQQVAYRMQLASARRVRHAAVAAALLADGGGGGDGGGDGGGAAVEPSVLAWHFGAAGEVETAVACWLQATARANRRCATAEALAHVEEALTLLDDLPAGERRTELETDLRLAMGTAIILAKGYSARGGETAFTEALALAETLGPADRLFAALWGLFCCASLRCDWPRARRLALRLMETAQRLGRPEMRLKAHYALGTASLWTGDSGVAETCLAIVCDEGAGAETDFLDPVDPMLSAQGLAALNAWQRGDAALADARLGDALERAERSGHPHHLASILGTALFYDGLRGDMAAMAVRAERLLTLSREHGFSLWLALGTLAAGTAQSGEAGLRAVRDGMNGWGRADASRPTPPTLFFQVWALVRARRWSAALEALGTLMDLADQTGGHGFAPELHRLRAECLAGLGDAAAAASAVRYAVMLADSQGAVALAERARRGLPARPAAVS